VTVEHVQKQTIQNKQNLEAKDPEAARAFRQKLSETAADPVRAREYLFGVSMLGSLKRAGEIQ
jgi:3-(3-hydroxy-phenyl)propionate hydroxylase